MQVTRPPVSGITPITKLLWLPVDLDTPRQEHAGLLDQQITHEIIYNPVLKTYLEACVRKLFLILFVVLIANILLTACASSNTDAPAKAVEDYWNVIVEKDAERLPTLVCGAWEEDALTALDALQAVAARLEDLSCSQTGTDSNTALVNCTGKMILTYDTEDQEIDLSLSTYEVVEEGGDWLVCGTR